MRDGAFSADRHHDAFDLSDQLVRLKVPPVMVSVLTMTYRYISTLLDEASSMSAAYALRSPNARG